MPRIERTVSALRKLNTGYLAECRILPGEMRWHDATGAERHTDLVLQHLPAGREFAEALLAEDKTTLLAALDALQAALGELEFTHNNLKETNLRWHRGRFVPIRYYDARIGTAELGTGDREAFAALRHRIAEAPAPRQTANDVTAHYNPLRRLTGHRWTSHVFEGLVCVEDDNGFGFVDTDNNPVIPAQFVWAGDFREGRAEVQTQTGMGLIDRRGCYVIPPEYEIVDYDPPPAWCMCATTGTGRCSTTWDAASRSSGRKSRSPAGLKFAGDNGNIRYFAVIGAFRLHWQTRPGGALPGTTGKGDRRDFGAYNHDNKYKNYKSWKKRSNA